MNKYLLLITGLLCSVWANAQVEQLPLMPYPQVVERQPGQLVLGSTISFAVEGKQSSAINKILAELGARIRQQTGQTLRLKKTSLHKARFIIRVEDVQPISHHIDHWDESYQLTISATHIELTAKQLVGAQRGVETLLQLVGTAPKITLPLVSIQDSPRFKWRGLLLDTSRHFFSIETIKRQLDAMAAAKYNIFHWHLTDDQGWRFESKKYPKLHKLASDGDYYTRKQIRDVVAYARARGIQVLPEIDMPGHASAIAVAYPELMSAPGPYAMEYRWGVHKPTLNPANEKVYEFADAIIGELAELFPFEYMHIGGDEVDPEHWNTNAQIQAFMQAQQLKDHTGLQAYFNQRLQKILLQHQRKMIGWDEIQHQDLPKDIVIQSWQGQDGVSHAVTHGFQAILSTGYYLDQAQTAAYHYRNDPIPPEPVLIENLGLDESSKHWSFEMPRKRGKPVTGRISIRPSENNSPARDVAIFVAFSGKSIRQAEVHHLEQNEAIFSLDTWMGPVEFRLKFNGDHLTGSAIVGNAPYSVHGTSQDQQLVANPESQTLPKNKPLTQAQQDLILGGEAALWSEIVDENSIDIRLWPRALVVAERLWSAQSVRDQGTMYERLAQSAQWLEKSVALQHNLQTQNALRRLWGEGEITALQGFIELLEPAYYYHRQHEKSVHESYSKADPLNRLVDALPAESESLRQFNLRLQQWLGEPKIDENYRQLERQLIHWQLASKALQPLLKRHPEVRRLVANTQQLIALTLELLNRAAERDALSAQEREALNQQLLAARQIEQEIVVALVTSTEKLIHSLR